MPFLSSSSHRLRKHPASPRRHADLILTLILQLIPGDLPLCIISADQRHIVRGKGFLEPGGELLVLGFAAVVRTLRLHLGIMLHRFLSVVG